MHSFCRTCLQETANDNLHVLAEDAKSLRLRTELSVCVPEMVLDKVIEPAVCFKCVKALHSAYALKMQCLQTEVRLNNYIETRNSDVSCASPQKIKIEDFLFHTRTVNKTSNAVSKPSPSDIINDLNNLLDEALLNVPKSRVVLEDKNKRVKHKDDFFEQRVTRLQDPGRGEDQKPIILGHGIVLKECFVQCEKLPSNVVNSQLAIMATKNTPRRKSNPKKRRSKRPLLECTLCPYRTQYEGRLKMHEKSHTEADTYTCHICNYCCRYKNNYMRHMTTHSDEKPFACEMCPYKCGYPALLKTHKKQKHLGQGLFSCSKCPYESANKPNLKRHISIHHSDVTRLFSCGMCAYKSPYRHNVSRHTAKHHIDGNL